MVTTVQRHKVNISTPVEPQTESNVKAPTEIQSSKGKLKGNSTEENVAIPNKCSRFEINSDDTLKSWDLPSRLGCNPHLPISDKSLIRKRFKR